jgi:hypothetical protein
MHPHPKTDDQPAFARLGKVAPHIYVMWVDVNLVQHCHHTHLVNGEIKGWRDERNKTRWIDVMRL